MAIYTYADKEGNQVDISNGYQTGRDYWVVFEANGVQQRKPITDIPVPNDCQNGHEYVFRGVIYSKVEKHNENVSHAADIESEEERQKERFKAIKAQYSDLFITDGEINFGF